MATNVHMLAHQQLLLTQRIERRGIIEVSRVTQRYMTDLLARFRKTRRLLSSKKYFEKSVPIIANSMALAYLQSYNATLARARRQKPTKLELYDDLLVSLAGIHDLDLDAIRKKFNTQAFNVVSKASKAVDSELRDFVSELIASGMHVRKAVSELTSKFTALGLTVKNSYQLETIFRTQSQLAYNAARWTAEQNPDIQEILWGYTYVTVGDDRVRPEHAALDGMTLPKDDKRWDLFWPPNGWSCRCQVISIFEASKVIQPKKGFEIDEDFRFNPGKVLAI